MYITYFITIVNSIPKSIIIGTIWKIGSETFEDHRCSYSLRFL